MELEEKKIGMAREKAKVKWILEGDENSKFFHAVIKNRERRNGIRGMAINGEWVEDPTRVKS